MTDYGILIDWDNNGYHAWDARPGDAPNLLGRGSANWASDTNGTMYSGSEDYITGFTVGQVVSRGAANTGNIKDTGLYRIRWATGTGTPYITTAANKLYIYRDYLQYIDLGTVKDLYGLTLAAGTYKLSLKLKSTAVSIIGLALAAVGRVSGSLASTAIGTITSAGYTQVMLTFTVASEQNVYFHISKSTTVNFTLDVIEPFLIAGGGTHPTAFNCGTASLSENLTADVMTARWNIGAKEPWRYVGDENRLRLTLTNRDDTYSLENSASPLYRSHRLGPMQIYIVANANGAGWQRLYTGYVETIRPQTMQNGRQTAELIAGTVRRLLDKQELEIALYENVDSPDLLAALLDFTSLVNVAPYLTKPLMIRFGAAFSTTDTQYTLAGDQWPSGTRVLDAVADVLEADFGKMWINRNGDAEYYLKLDYDAIFALSMDDLDDTVMTAADYEIIPARANLVSAYSYPRKITTAATFVLWESDSPIEIEAGDTVEITVRYTVQNDDRTIGGKNTTVDTFTASGGGITYNWSEDDARGGTLQITSAASVTRTVTAVVIKGKKITWFNALRQKFRDQDAINKWGKVTEVIENKLVEKVSVAKRLAQRAVGEFGEPRGVMKSIRLLPKTEAQRADFLAYKPGSFIRVTEGQTHHSSRHMVIGEEHELREGMKLHIMKLYLEQLPRWLVLDDDDAGILDAGYYFG